MLPLADATDPTLCGGKATGLAHLESAGFTVPAAICVTTEFYKRWLEASGISRRLKELVSTSAATRRQRLANIRDHIETASIPEGLAAALAGGIADLRTNGDALCVRSSAVHEDRGAASHAGIHASVVVAKPDVSSIIAAIKRCWASLWTEAAWSYRDRLGVPHAEAAMAVVVQRFIPAERAGVAFSVDPLTHDHATMLIEAGFGTAEALVSGRTTPDQYWITVEDGVPARVRRQVGRGQAMALTESQALDLARLVKAVEQKFGEAVDVEWVFDSREFWAVQARPITSLGVQREDTPEPGTRWTRANLKEIFPELPSPLALSYLMVSLNSMFRSYHAAQGYALPPDARLVSVFHGRPYLNLSLMQQLAIERGGDPTIVTRLFGGADVSTPSVPAQASRPRVSVGNMIRLAREMLATFFRTPNRGRRLFRKMGRQATALRMLALDRLDDRALVAHLQRFGGTTLNDRTVRRLHEVVSAQSRAYMALDQVLAAWLDSDSETIMKRLMTGLGTLPNVRMTYRLMALGRLAAAEPTARAFFEGELGADAIARYETALAGTQLLVEFQAFLGVFGHRGPYESDAMSPRFSEDPAPLLRLIQLYMRAGTEDPAQHAADRLAVRRAATDEVRRALGEGRGRLAFQLRWGVFSIMCGALQRLVGLRDECRHVTTMLVAHLRRIVLEIGRRAARDGVLASPDDAFFVTWEELPRILLEREHDWRGVALARRRERQRHEGIAGPDLLGSDVPAHGAATNGR
ncbi:MAG TPA: PEP/pyruvate-binding domain-containing protein, partial [Vicinamibacterales bacterium]|nr:PEP/pyruvate-binding domain-containing protein [Vicinamibacterales bacterium]